VIRRLVVVLLCLLVVASGVAWSAATVTWQKEGEEAQSAEGMEALTQLDQALAAEEETQGAYEGEPIAKCYLLLSDEEDNELDEQMKAKVDEWRESTEVSVTNWLAGVEFEEEKLSEAEETWDVADTPAFVATWVDESGEEKLVEVPPGASEGTKNPVVGVGDDMAPSVETMMGEIETAVKSKIAYKKVYTVGVKPDGECEKKMETCEGQEEFKQGYDRLAREYGNTVADFEPLKCGIALWAVLGAGAGLMGLGGAIYRRGTRRRES
jgi:hypothetical protein